MQKNTEQLNGSYYAIQNVHVQTVVERSLKALANILGHSYHICFFKYLGESWSICIL